MRVLAVVMALLALAACSGTTLNGRASQHGPDRVTIGFPW
jgi:hypothetical protein